MKSEGQPVRDVSVKEEFIVDEIKVFVEKECVVLWYDDIKEKGEVD
jgi:hypothetical protein